MPSKRATGSRSTVIRCPNCGEDYSITYKRCPFCDEKAAPKKKRPERREELPEDQGEERRSGGKHLMNLGGEWSPVRIAGTVASLAVIIAAVWIVATQIVPLVNRGEHLGGDQDPAPPPATQSVGESLPPTGSLPPQSSDGLTEPTAPVSSAAPAGSPSPAPSPEATPTPKPSAPAGQTATGFTLNKSDISMSDQYPEAVTLKVTFTPAGTTGTVTWTSSDPDIASVDANGKVTHGTKNGMAVITATMGDGTKQECKVRCNFSNPGASGGSADSGALSLNREDFTLKKAGETFQMKVSGTSSTPVWAIGDSSVATISGDGKVTAVAKGTTTITCTVDGKTLQCIVRCTW